MSDKERQLKILPRYFPRRWKDAIFPEIRLAGKWLQDLGFRCGNFVLITQGESSITITVLPEVKAEPQPVKQDARKAEPVFSPELDNLPGDQLFRVLTSEDYHAYIAKLKEQKRRRKKAGSARAWQDFKKERQATLSNTPTIQPDQKIVQAAPRQGTGADDQMNTSDHAAEA